MSVNLIENAVSHDLPRHKKPVSNFKPDHSKGWSFSFKYYKQIDFFGLKAESPAWFSALLDRLQDFCSKKPDDFNSNHAEKRDYRYHPIDWNARNIPVKREDLDWIDRDIIENEADFPFYQFQISKANGRIVGFWDVKQTVFHIVLLDPKHNIQPAGGKFNYRVDKTSILPCKYTSLIVELDLIKNKKCFCEKCTFKNELTLLQDKYNVGNFVYFQLDDDFYAEFRSRTQDMSIAECVENWLINN
jgi:hypothetical protein